MLICCNGLLKMVRLGLVVAGRKLDDDLDERAEIIRYILKFSLFFSVRCIFRGVRCIASSN